MALLDKLRALQRVTPATMPIDGLEEIDASERAWQELLNRPMDDAERKMIVSLQDLGATIEKSGAGYILGLELCLGIRTISATVGALVDSNEGPPICNKKKNEGALSYGHQ